MSYSSFNKPTLTLLLTLSLIAGAIGVSAYSEPIGSYPINTFEPVDISNTDQAKTGGLGVEVFAARGNADFKKDLQIEGVSEGGSAGDAGPSNIQIQSNVLATGTLSTKKDTNGTEASWPRTFSSGALVHTEPNLKPVCADGQGIIVFCVTPDAPPPPVVDLCSNIDGNQATVPQGYTRNSANNTCNRVLTGTVTIKCEETPTVQFDNYWHFTYINRMTFTFDQPVLPNTELLFGATAFGLNTHPSEGPALPVRGIWGRSMIPAAFANAYPGWQYSVQNPFTFSFPANIVTQTIYPVRNSPAKGAEYPCTFLANTSNIYVIPNGNGWNTVPDRFNTKDIFFKLAPGSPYDAVQLRVTNPGITIHNL